MNVKPLAVRAENIGYKYGRHVALENLSATFEPGKITGLLGRNGSGKSTLAMGLAGQIRMSGKLDFRFADVDALDREDAATNTTSKCMKVWENPSLMPLVALVSDSTSLVDGSIRQVVDLWEAMRPTFSRPLAEHLIDLWSLDPKRNIEKLSRGQKSALYATLGLASRAPLTIFDEVHLGMDAVVRREFYDTLLADFIEFPRTIIVSSHLVDEIEDIIENVVIIEHGTTKLSGNADDLRQEYSHSGQLASLTDVLIAATRRDS